MGLSPFPPISTIFIIAGLIFMFIAVVAITGIYNFHVINRYFAFCIGVILVLGGVFLAAEYGTIGINVKNPEITINYTPDTAHIEENMNGTAKNISEGDEIWIFVHPDGDKYYPQRSNAVIQNGKWSLSVGIGSENDANKKFDIIAVLADTKAQKEINSYFTEYEKTGERPGMDKVPDNAKEYDRITVTRLPVTPEIKITYPLDGAQVGVTESVKGTQKNIPEGDEIWIFVHPHTVNKYYPQRSSAVIQNGEWSLSVGIGSENNAGTEFDIISVLADTNAQDEINKYFEECEKTGKWPGMDKIPDSAKEYSRIIVTRLPVNPTEIQITYPLNTANIQENIQGTAKNIPDGQTAWLLIYPHTAYKYYPQNKLDIRDEKWSYPAQFGESKDAGTQFDIIIVLADQEAHAELANYLETCIETKNWPGITTLPVGVTEYAKVTVTRV